MLYRMLALATLSILTVTNAAPVTDSSPMRGVLGEGKKEYQNKMGAAVKQGDATSASDLSGATAKTGIALAADDMQGAAYASANATDRHDELGAADKQGDDVSKSIRSDTPTAEMGVALVAGGSGCENIHQSIGTMLYLQIDPWLVTFSEWARQGKLDKKMALIILEGIGDILESIALSDIGPGSTSASGTGQFRTYFLKKLNDRVKAAEEWRELHQKPMKDDGCHYKMYEERMITFTNNMKLQGSSVYWSRSQCSIIKKQLLSKLNSIITRGLASIRKDMRMLGCVEQ